MNDTLRATLHTIPRAADNVFVSRNGKPFIVHNTFGRAVKKAGLVDLHFHDLRHCFASNLVMSGVDLVTVGRLLGQKSLRMTSRYAHVSMEHVKKSVRVLDGYHLVTMERKTIVRGS